MSGVVAQLVARIGARPLMLTGAAVTTGGMYWLSQHQRAQPPTPAGCSARSWSPRPAWACCSCRCPWSRSTGSPSRTPGVASSLLNTGQQVGGAIGLAALGTVAWTAVANSVRTQLATAPRPVTRPRRVDEVRPGAGGDLPPRACGRASPAASWSRQGSRFAALIIAAVTIRIRRGDLAASADQEQPLSDEVAFEPVG